MPAGIWKTFRKVYGNCGSEKIRIWHILRINIFWKPNKCYTEKLLKKLSDGLYFDSLDQNAKAQLVFKEITFFTLVKLALKTKYFKFHNGDLSCIFN